MSTHQTHEHVEHASHQEHHQPSVYDVLIESNTINFVIVLALLIWAIGKFIPKMAKERKADLEKEIQDAREAKEQAELKLKELEAKLEESKEESKVFLENAKKTAVLIKEESIEEARKQIEIMQDLAEKDISSQREQAMNSIKQKVAQAAYQLAEASLSSNENKEKITEALEANFKDDLAGVKI